MKKFLIIATSTMILAIASPAFAGEGNAQCTNTSSEWMSLDAAKAKVAEQGYDARRVTREDGCYEVYAIGKDGARVELYLNPVTGKIVKTKTKS